MKKEKWIFIAPIYLIGLALSIYALMFTKFGTMKYWVSVSISIICIATYSYKRNRYIHNNRDGIK